MEQWGNDSVVFIMAGGAGTRLWPLGTRNNPKQFLKLFDTRSLFQQSYDRIAEHVPADRIFVLTGDDYVDLAANQLPDIPSRNIIGEPERKDTAAAVCLGALVAGKRFGNPVMVVLTADHVIEPIALFRQTLQSAVSEARRTSSLYTFGITPTDAATGYGYLEIGEKTADTKGIEHFRVASFREKPDAETANRYLESGRYLWNSGMFVWTVEAILSELERHLPEHVRELERAVEELDTPRRVTALRSAFSVLQRISIDYAVMEKARDARCVAARFTWKDLGGWRAVRDFLPGDDQGNHLRGRTHVADARNNLVFCENAEETVVLAGTQDLVIVRAGNRTLVAAKDRLEMLQQIVESLDEDERA